MSRTRWRTCWENGRREQLMLHAATALLHNGKFLLANAISPDGSIVPEEERFHPCIDEADLHRGRISEQINSGF